MSIIATALRLSAVRALTGAGTLAGDRVFDSAVLAMDKLATERPEPFACVSTDDEQLKPAGRDLQTGDREIALVIETAVTKAVTVPGGDDGVAIPDTDAGLEICLSILQRQIEACLFGRGGGAWGDAFRALTGNIKTVDSHRGTLGDKGVRVAARQTVYMIGAIAEPAFGSPPDPGSPLAAFLTAAAADETTASIATALSAAVEGLPVDWPAVFTAAAVAGGLTEDQAAALGLASVPLGEEPTEVSEVALSNGFAVNEAAADEQLPGGDDD